MKINMLRILVIVAIILHFTANVFDSKCRKYGFDYYEINNGCYHIRNNNMFDREYIK